MSEESKANIRAGLAARRNESLVPAGHQWSQEANESANVARTEAIGKGLDEMAINQAGLDAATAVDFKPDDGSLLPPEESEMSSVQLIRAGLQKRGIIPGDSNV